MSNRDSLTEDMLRRSLGPTDRCPGIEELESLASGEANAASRWAEHLRVCGYCQSELHLLKTFLMEKPREANAEKAAELLGKKRKAIFREVFAASQRVPWWKAAFTARRIAQASFAMAAILLAVSAVLYFRPASSRPQLEARNGTSPEVLRSGSFTLLGPAGDLQERPTEMRWEPFPAAASYQVRVWEVDRHEVWEAKTTDTRIDLPETFRAQIVPAKTLIAGVTAFDSSGNQVAATELVRFRLVQSRK